MDLVSFETEEEWNLVRNLDDYDDQDGDNLDLDHSGNVKVGGNLITTM